MPPFASRLGRCRLLLMAIHLQACATTGAPLPAEPAAAVPVSGVDCHMHLSGEEATAEASSAAALAALDEAGLSHGCLLSQGSHVAPGCADRGCEAQRAFTEAQNDRVLAV